MSSVVIYRGVYPPVLLENYLLLVHETIDLKMIKEGVECVCVHATGTHHQTVIRFHNLDQRESVNSKLGAVSPLLITGSMASGVDYIIPS